MEIIKRVNTVRELLDVLKAVPDYMLDVNIDCTTPDGMQAFELACIEVIDQIEDGNRVTMVRLSGEEE